MIVTIADDFDLKKIADSVQSRNSIISGESTLIIENETSTGGGCFCRNLQKQPLFILRENPKSVIIFHKLNNGKER